MFSRTFHCQAASYIQRKRKGTVCVLWNCMSERYCPFYVALAVFVFVYEFTRLYRHKVADLVLMLNISLNSSLYFCICVRKLQIWLRHSRCVNSVTDFSWGSHVKSANNSNKDGKEIENILTRNMTSRAVLRNVL